MDSGFATIFKPLSREEYDRLTLNERLDYLQRLQTDIAAKVDDSRRQLETAKRRCVDDTGGY